MLLQPLPDGQRPDTAAIRGKHTVASSAFRLCHESRGPCLDRIVTPVLDKDRHASVVALIIVTVHLACDQGALDLGKLMDTGPLRAQIMSQLLWQRQAHVLDALRVQEDVVARTHEGEQVRLVRQR